MADLIITASMKQSLLEAMKWLKVLTVLGTIGLGLVAVLGVIFLFMPSSSLGVSGVAAAFVYFVCCAIYYYPIKKCYGIVGNMREAINDDSQASLECCAEDTCAVLRYLGVLSLVVVAIYAFAFIVGIIAGGMGGMLH